MEHNAGQYLFHNFFWNERQKTLSSCVYASCEDFKLIMWWYSTWYWKEVCSFYPVCVCVYACALTYMLVQRPEVKVQCPPISFSTHFWIMFSPFPDTHRLIRVLDQWISLHLCNSSIEIPGVTTMTCFWCEIGDTCSGSHKC